MPSQDYVLVEKILTDGDIPLSLYENKVTGLRVVIAQAECPISKLDIFFATEAYDDDGLPHTLEHLVFMGSEDYPHKGLLDLLANRCLADGTNACTDTDHTNYVMSAAGTEGLLNLLPIYLEHLLFPIITDATYMTEVHHINGEGEDAGVVYCEMQARENTGDERCHVELMRSLYPGKCGYSSQTGGILDNLRNSTSVSKVRNYHKKYYNSKNCCIVVTGPFEAKEVFASIKSIEDKIVLKGMHNIPFERAWTTPVEPLAASLERKIQYSCDTDDDGIVYVGFRGPNVTTNYKEYYAMDLLLDYLDETAVSPIQRDFVECEEPVCGDVSHCVIENSTACFYFAFEGVNKEHLDSVSQKLLALLGKIQTKGEKFDLERMRTLLSRQRVRILSVAESSPHKMVIGPVIGHVLYGNGEIKERAQTIPYLDEFITYDESYWLGLIERYITGPNARHVTIVGEPSPELMKSMAEAETDRIAAQKDKLKEKLATMGDTLKKAVEINERQAPSEVITSVPIPSPDHIKYHAIERSVLGPEAGLPFRVQYDSIKTNFVTIHLMMNTSQDLTKADRLYLPILTEMILKTPIMRGDQLVPYEKIVAELYSDTIAYDCGIGISSSGVSCGAFSMLLGLMMQVEVSKYERAVHWFHELLYQTVLAPERIKSIATQLVSDISQYKRSGSKVASSTMNSLTYQSNCNQWATNFLRQHTFLKRLLKDLKETPAAVQQELTRVRDLLTKPANLLVHIGCNKDKLDVSKLHEPWQKFVPASVLAANSKDQIQFDQIVPCHKLVDFIPSPKSAIVGIGSAESGYLNLVVKSIDSLKHPDLAPILVLINYLTQLEGPLWRQIRGLGLSYHYSISLSTSNGLMSFHLHRSSQLVAAYDKTVEIIESHLKGTEEFEESLIDSAKSQLVFGMVSGEKSPADRSMQSLIAYLRDLDMNFNKDLIKKIATVTREDIRRVGAKYLKPLFEDADRRMSICCHTSKVAEISEGLAKSKIELERLSIEKESFLTSLDKAN